MHYCIVIVSAVCFFLHTSCKKAIKLDQSNSRVALYRIEMFYFCLFSEILKIKKAAIYAWLRLVSCDTGIVLVKISPMHK